MKKAVKKKPMRKRVKPLRETKTPCVVKRAGHEEVYDERKVYATCYYAAKSTHLKTNKAEEICDKVVKDVNKWIVPKGCVTGHQIHEYIVKSLKKYNKDVAFMYDTHRDVN